MFLVTKLRQRKSKKDGTCIVNGSIRNFNFSFEHLISAEGGYSNHPSDTGGATNFGITQKTLEAYRGQKLKKSEVKNLTIDEARAIYLTEYWLKMNLDRIESQELCCILFDQGVNKGPKNGIKMLQLVLHNDFKKDISIDGILGPITAKEANSILPRHLFVKIIQEAQRGYLDIWKRNPSQGVFLRGWIARTWRMFDLL